MYNAYETIDKYRLVILTGNPGVGKTTTCKMLGNLFTSRKDSKYLILERSIAEVQEVIDLFNKIYRDEKSKKLLVIFDDFLGRNTLDASEQQIKKLRNLYSILRYSENLYVILNSRTQIINTAKGDNLEFREFLDGKKEEKITINMSNYTDIEKAYIFRKNIEKVFSTKNLDEKIIMNEKYKDIIENENYLKIIKHQNFNPRLISLIASKSVESSGNYYEYCINSLHNPSRIYDELFRKLSNGAQYFLLSLYCFENYPVKLSQLEDAFNLLKMDKAYDLKQIEEDLEDSWIVIRNDETFENETINFANPSIIDYLSTKKSGLKPAFNKIANETKYLAQILKIEGGVGLYRRIKNNFDYYYDKYSYSGEKLNLIFKENNMFISEKEYRDLLYIFKGEYHNDAPPLFLSSHWDSLIESLYDSNNKTAQSIFLNELLFSSSNRLLINNIFQDVDIDNIAKNLDLLLLDFYNEGLSQNELINFSEEKTGLNLFAQISNYKKEQLQSKIDSFEDADSFLDLVDSISIEDEVESVTEEIVENYQEHLFKELRFSFFNNYIDEDDLDFSDFDSQVFDVAKDFFNTIDNDDDQEEYNIDKKSMEYTETLDTILGRPLL
nr:ATP-binding protein [Oceanobacillus jeddahense]